MKSDVLIVGAGVAGLMTAIELADSGLNVQIFDAGQAGMESSWAGGGILSPIYPWRYPDAVNALVQWSNQHYPDYLRRISELAEVDPQLQMSGHLILQQRLSDHTVQQWLASFPQHAEQVDTRQLMQIEPELNNEFTHGIWLPDIGQVRNPRFVKALKAAAMKHSIVIHEQTPVEQVIHAENRVTGIKTDSAEIHADTVIVTAGAWSANFRLGSEQLSVEPVKGQMIQFQTEPGTIKRIALYDGRYVIPRKDGKVLVGSTLEHCGFDKTINEPTKGELHTIAAHIYPVLEDTPIINHWAGLRPGNERQTPFIGQHPTIGRLYYNTGHYRNGIVTGLASARLCADLVTGRTPILPPEHYSLQ